MREPQTLAANRHPQTAPVAPLAGLVRGHVSGSSHGTAGRRRAVLLAVLPAALVTLLGTVLIALLATDLSGSGGLPAVTGFALLVGALLTCAVLAGAGFLAAAQARASAGRTAQLSAALDHARSELADVLQQLKQRDALPEPLADALGPLADAAVAPAVWSISPVREGIGPREEQDVKFEVFINLARRLQSLVHREIGLLDDLENEAEDPDLLKGLFQVDHLATRIRHYAENLAVLGGAVAYCQWSSPVRVSDILRSAVAEIEQYARVKLVPPMTGTVRGHAVADVVHLLAELTENATVFSAPQTRVLLRTERVTAGLAIEIEDRGLGLTSAERKQLNALLAAPDRVALGDLLRDGRIGLYVVSTLARRHGITVQLQGNIYGGTQAVVILPPEVLGERPTATGQQTAPPQPLPAARPGPPQDAPAPAAVAALPRPAPATSRVPAGASPLPAGAAPARQAARPRLPQRRRPERFSAELRRLAQGGASLEDVEHNPELMAAFQAGVRMAEDDGDTGRPAAHGEDTP